MFNIIYTRMCGTLCPAMAWPGTGMPCHGRAACMKRFILARRGTSRHMTHFWHGTDLANTAHHILSMARTWHMGLWHGRARGYMARRVSRGHGTAWHVACLLYIIMHI